MSLQDCENGINQASLDTHNSKREMRESEMRYRQVSRECLKGETVLNTSSSSGYTKVLAHQKISFCHWMNTVAVHDLIIFSEIIGFDHSIICIKSFLYLKHIFTLFFCTCRVLQILIGNLRLSLSRGRLVCL